MEYEQAWLTYKRKNRKSQESYFHFLYMNEESTVVRTAAAELRRAALEIMGIQMRNEGDAGKAGILLLCEENCKTGREGYQLEEKEGQIKIISEGAEGLLYGSFALIRLIQLDKELTNLSKSVRPSNPLRMLNHWDNADGSIERGYSGNSFFFHDQKLLVNDRTIEYARLAASVGINGCVINNVNVRGNASRLIDYTYGEEVKALAELFLEYGIRLYISLNFAAPMELGNLPTADPMNKEVRCWWKNTMDDIFKRIPGLGGFLVKADSEGRPGPFTYGRTHADGANMLAEAVAPYGGLIIWRCFVYDCQQDWRDKKTDRARSGYDNFKPLDGSFLDNVILQVKNGPMDFQVREPVSPLLLGLEKTNQMLEVQIAQEYTGQQRHVCYLIPMFKEILNFPCKGETENDSVSDIIGGKTYHNLNCGMAAVANTGDDENWTGHDLAAANLYGFGRLSFQTELTGEEIAEEWVRCTYGNEKDVVVAIKKILMMSWPAYEMYTSPLGIGWMVNPGHHYGPNVDGYEYDRWGTYHRADHLGIGVDRSMAGTGFTGQYPQPLCSMYDNLDTCPDELLLFFHHVLYTYRLKSGKTVIQHIYDTHFEGANKVKEMADLWDSLNGKVPDKVFKRVKLRFEHQIEHSKEWRDQVNSYFFRKSMIKDEKRRIIY